jgi:membrane-associated phospholipid phosphatase
MGILKILLDHQRKTQAENIRDFTSLGNPLLLAVLSLILLGPLHLWVIYVAFLIAQEIFATALKLLLFRDRPKKESYSNILEKVDAGAFPSIHSARACFTSLVLAFFSAGDLRYALLILPFIVGYTRMKLGKHKLVDVFAGLVIGALFFTLFWVLMRR